MEVSGDELQELYSWVDEVPLSRIKRHLSRDFADGVLMAELVHFHHPRLVQLHNYSGANGTGQKLYNWSTLNQKVFKRLGFVIARGECELVCSGEQGAIERVLKLVKVKMAEYAESSGLRGSQSDMQSFDEQSIASTSERAAVYEGSSDQPQSRRASMQQPNRSILDTPSSTGNEQQHSELHQQREQDDLEFLDEEALTPAVREALEFRQDVIEHLQATNEALELKVQKLEQLLQLKNAKMQTLLAQLQDETAFGYKDVEKDQMLRDMLALGSGPE